MEYTAQQYREIAVSTLKKNHEHSFKNIFRHFFSREAEYVNGIQLTGDINNTDRSCVKSTNVSGNQQTLYRSKCFQDLSSINKLDSKRDLKRDAPFVRNHLISGLFRIYLYS